MLSKLLRKVTRSFRRRLGLPLPVIAESPPPPVIVEPGPAPDVVRRRDACRAGIEGRIGLEIGGPSSMFGPEGQLPIYPLAARIDNCNFGRRTVWEGEVAEEATFRFDPLKAPGRQYIAEATDLAEIPSASYDFVLASHVLEHSANPLRALAEWTRVLRPNGVMVLIVPHKDATFDHRRPVTAFEHLLEDHARATSEADLSHLDEILAWHDLTRDPAAGAFDAFRERSLRNAENRCLHQHVFDTRLAVRATHWAGLKIALVEPFPAFHILVVARKLPGGQQPNNTRFLRNDPPPWTSPFSSDGDRFELSP